MGEDNRVSWLRAPGGKVLSTGDLTGLWNTSWGSQGELLGEVTFSVENWKIRRSHPGKEQRKGKEGWFKVLKKERCWAFKEMKPTSSLWTEWRTLKMKPERLTKADPVNPVGSAANHCRGEKWGYPWCSWNVPIWKSWSFPTSPAIKQQEGDKWGKGHCWGNQEKSEMEAGKSKEAQNGASGGSREFSFQSEMVTKGNKLSGFRETIGLPQKFIRVFS